MHEPGEELDQLARSVIGAAIEVHRELGPGFLESVHEEALAVEMGLRRIPFARQPLVEVRYKGTRVGHGRLDFLVGERRGQAGWTLPSSPLAGAAGRADPRGGGPDGSDPALFW